MAPKKHLWVPKERDTLEIMYKEYGYGPADEEEAVTITGDDDVVAIFNHIFEWNAPALRLREEWQFRGKPGRNPKWKSVHSKTNIDDYTEKEKIRREEVRLRVLRAAGELGIDLAPVARFAGLHAAAVASAAGVANINALPALLPAVKQHDG